MNESEKDYHESSIADAVNKVLIKYFAQIMVSLMLTGVVTSATLLWQVSSAITNHTYRIEQLESEIKAIRNSYVTQAQLLETLKRVEQQLEIMMLKAGMQTKVGIFTGKEK